MYVYFQAYKPAQPGSLGPSGTQPQTANAPAQPNAQPGALPIFAFVTLYQEGKKLFETPPQSVVPSPTSRLGVMSMSFDLGVDELPRGSYDCQVTVVDPSTQKAAFWRTSISLVQ